MAIDKTDTLALPNRELTIDQKNKITLCETAFDAILKLQGHMSIQLILTRDEVIRKELDERYTKAGWHVKFVGVSDRDHFFIDILP